MVNGHRGSTPWYAKGFPPEKLEGHYHDHAKDFKCKSRAEYNNAAIDFMNKKPNSSIDYFVDSRGTVYKFDHDTHEFGIADVNGNIVTYYIRKNNPEEYWEEQIRIHDDDH